jgi:phospholipid-binding lipoprotein MlaA
MKIICWIYFLLAVCLTTLLYPCVASSSPEVFISTSSFEEPALLEAEVEPVDPVETAESLTYLRPEPALADRPDEGPVRVAIANVPPAPVETEEEVGTIPDPIEPVNRAFFTFNDKLYFWVLKPVASGYKSVAPEVVRVSVRNFFSHLTTPVRLVNCLLQADVKCAGIETARFVLNTAIGFAGFFDSARTGFNFEKQDRDFGQTLGIWGMGPVFYIDLPILGPSSLRDFLGFIVDVSFDPRTYLAFYFATISYANTGGWVLDKINEASLSLGEYEELKRAALDPYIALREAYHQYRQSKIGK